MDAQTQADFAEPTPRTVDLEARLDDPIVGVQLKETKLADAIQFLSDYSTIPISIDVENIAWAKATSE